MEFAYNASQHRATGYSPSQVNTGRVPNLPIDLISFPTAGASSHKAYTYATDVADLHQRVHERITTYNAKIKASADVHRRPSELQEGSMVMIQLRPERHAAEKAHKLHPRAADPFQVRRKINPNAYDIDIPPKWGIPTTFNISDIIPYQGLLEVPTESGLLLDSTESSLLELEENDGPYSPLKEVTADDVLAVPTRTEGEVAAPNKHTERLRRSTKPTTRIADFVYF